MEIEPVEIKLISGDELTATLLRQCLANEEQLSAEVERLRKVIYEAWQVVVNSRSDMTEVNDVENLLWSALKRGDR